MFCMDCEEVPFSNRGLASETCVGICSEDFYYFCCSGLFIKIAFVMLVAVVLLYIHIYVSLYFVTFRLVSKFS